MATKLTFDNLPEAVEQIQADITDLRELFSANTNQQKENRPMVLPEAAQFLHLSKASIYRLVGARSIPYHKQGGKLMFLESELMEWVTRRA